MPNDAYQLTRVTGPPYQVGSATDQWLLYVRIASHSLEQLLIVITKLVVPQPCVAKLRVYGEPPDLTHVVRVDSPSVAIAMLDQCEAVAVFDSGDPSRDAKQIIEALSDPRGFEDDEACVLRAVQPRPVAFLHAGHEDIDVVCGRRDADRVVALLRQDR